MTIDELKRIVFEQTRRLPEAGLVILTEGNVSQISPDRKFFIIKPSGIEYDDLTPEKMVAVDMEGNIIGRDLRPSTDTKSHLEIYKRFPEIGGITHTHSPFATIFAQMQKPIPPYGTTHADAFFGEVPVTRHLTEKEIAGDFEINTGKVICEILEDGAHKCVLVASHGPFAFGRNAKEAVDHAHILEKVAMMAALGQYDGPMKDALLKRHHLRKHGDTRYYGQN